MIAAHCGHEAVAKVGAGGGRQQGAGGRVSAAAYYQNIDELVVAPKAAKMATTSQKWREDYRRI